MTLQNVAAVATILTLLVSLLSIAFSARRYLSVREREQEKERFQIYHQLLKTISKGVDHEGPLKLVSQVALVSELVKYPEYSSSSRQALNLLRQEWTSKEPEHIKKPLIQAIDEALSLLEQRK